MAQFDLTRFLPYLLNQAAEESSLAFNQVYKDRYGMLRTEWRVLFHLGRYGEMTARDIGARAKIHKTKISRAVAGLEGRGYLRRAVVEADRRQELLRLTATGQRVYADLSAKAEAHDRALAAQFTAQEVEVLRRCLVRLAGI